MGIFEVSLNSVCTTAYEYASSSLATSTETCFYPWVHILASIWEAGIVAIFAFMVYKFLHKRMT